MIIMFVLLNLLPFLLYCLGHTELVSSEISDCNFNSSIFFCAPDNSISVCYYCYDNQVICVVLPDIILFCRKSNIYLLDSYCFIYEPKRKKIFVGYCPYSNLQNTPMDTIYQIVPQNISELRCDESLKRSGILCGECEDDYYPLAYSYNLTCVPCPEGHINILKVLLVLFVPLTVFCVVIVIFKINVFSSHLHGLVFYSQAVSAPAFIRVVFNGSYIQQYEYFIVVKFLLLFYSVWNLDIFRSFSPGICLQVKARDIPWFDLAIGIYPLIVLAATYFIIQSCNYNFTSIVFFWRQVPRVFTKSWNISSSLLDAFATFIILSNVKIMTSSMDLLTFIRVYDFSNNNYTNHQWRLYYDPTVELFHGNYRINFCLSLLVMLVFIVLPLLFLLLYPCRCFQKCLNRTACNWNTLHIFMDTFQGSFKNGTEPGEHDFRWFSAVFFGGRTILALLSMVTVTFVYYVLAAIVVVWIVLLIIILEPFRPAVKKYSYSTSMFLLLLSIFYIIVPGYNFATVKGQANVIDFYMVIVAVSIIPLTCICLLVLHGIRSVRAGTCIHKC